jgi:hypothetical protein
MFTQGIVQRRRRTLSDDIGSQVSQKPCNMVLRDTEIAENTVRFSEPTDMTIDWKALEEHFLMVSLVFLCNYLPQGKMHFSVS